MKKNIIFSLTLALLCHVFAAQAKVVTPDQALQRARGSKAAKAMSMGKNAALRPSLAYTQVTAKGAPAAYVFNYDGGKGYMILAGDDVATPVLGYNSKGTLDTDAMPPQLKWWLEEYARQIEYAEAHGATSITSDSRQASAGTQAIAPLIKTHWDQGEPYNGKCPMLNAQRTYTGCVATSMAQVMYYFKYPAVGQNSISYNDDEGCGKRLSLNFATRRFDWDNMLETYRPGQYNETQAEAVASLMQATGYSVKMSYAADASGALAMDIKRGLIRYFNYDPNIEYALRSYYSTTEWKQKIIDNLKNVGPILYGGASMLGGGHSFILDGYDGNGYFHFNWGWSEMSDGYYLLEALNPSSLGAGGGAGGGYNFTQDALFGVQPPTGKPAVEQPIRLTQHGSLTATMDGSNLKLALEGESQCMWVNYNPETMRINMGALFRPQADPTGEPVAAVTISTNPIQVQAGYGVPPEMLQMTIKTEGLNLADGKYIVNIATRDNTDDDAPWVDVRSLYGSSATVVVEKKGDRYTVTSVPPVEIKIASADFLHNLYIGCSNEVKVEIVNNSDYELTRGLAPILFFTNGEVAFLGESVMVNLAPGERITKTWSTGFTAMSQQAAYLTSDTEVVFTFYDESTGNMYTKDVLSQVTMHANPGAPMLKFDSKPSIENARYDLSMGDNMEINEMYYVNDLSDLHIKAKFTLQSGVIQYPVVACVLSQDGEQYAIETYEGYNVFMSDKGQKHEFDTHVNFSQGEPGKVYYFTLAIVVNGNLQAITDLKKFTTETTGVDNVTSADKQLTYDGHSLKADGHAITVYNLQGSKVADGRDSIDTGVLAPGLYIARAGNETLKFTVK